MLVGKTVTAEFAVHKLNETVNPHDFTKTPGTSSSGSAVAVATGMVPITLGTQTAGSIVRPASFLQLQLILLPQDRHPTCHLLCLNTETYRFL